MEKRLTLASEFSIIEGTKEHPGFKVLMIKFLLFLVFGQAEDYFIFWKGNLLWILLERSGKG